MKYLSLDKQGDIARIWIDDPDEKMNVIKAELMEELNDVLDQLDKDTALSAVVLISKKDHCFIAGADINMFQNMPTSEEARDRAKQGHQLLQRLSSFRVPTVAAVRGVCLGGGLEVAMACQYRIAAEEGKTIFGLPEVKLGLLPGLAGTQRLPRLVGLTNALDMLLTGKNVYARKAKKIGLVDELVQPYGLGDSAVIFARKPKRNKVKRNTMEKLLNGPLRGIVFSQAAKKALKMTHGNYPAPLKILDCVKTGLSKGMDAGTEAEIRNFDELVRGDVSKSLVQLFFNMTESKKNPMADKVRPVKQLGILGAGLMGSGIAEVTAPRDIRIILKDIKDDVLARGEKAVHDVYRKKVKRRIMKPFEMDRTLSRIHTTMDDRDLARCDLIIEAVFEDLDLKQRILADMEAVTPDHCIFASNTSAIPIADIAAKAKRPEQVIGMHYFSPVGKMPLLEIVVTDQTADWVTATAVDIGIKQGKNIIVVKDGPGFYTTRILGPLLNEAVTLLEEGADITQMDKVMNKWGFPVGPVTLMDEVGIDVGAHVGDVFEGMLAERDVTPNHKLKELYEAGYEGRKNKKGFYRYDGKKKGPKQVNEDVYRFFGGTNRKQMDADLIIDRLVLPMLNESAYCLQEGILANPKDGDLGAIMGLGFPPFRGGPFAYMDACGLDNIVTRMEKLAETHGARYKPAPILKERKAFH